MSKKQITYKGKTVEKTRNGKTDTQKQIGSKPFETDPAYVNYRLGATLNMGSYESIKVDIGVTMPCLPTWPEINKTYKNIRKEVEHLMDTEVQSIRKAAK